MKPAFNSELKTFGDSAFLAITKHFQKILKHESGVLQDKDPEELHQMRVGMRRLRSTIVGFLSALALPKEANEKAVGKVARTLGILRDIDVLGEALTTHYQPLLTKKEQKRLDKVLEVLKDKRKQAFKKVKEVLQGETYLTLKQSFQSWLDCPTYQPIAALSIEHILPDLLLPQVSKLLLHPSWVVGIEFASGESQFPDGLSHEEVEKLLNEQGIILHDLRKEAKRSRYNMELFTQFYGENYQNYLTDIKLIQTILGEIQDGFVLAEFLTNIFEEDFSQELPTLAEQLRQNRYQKWQDWEPLQRKFLNPETRQDFHKTVLHPIC